MSERGPPPPDGDRDRGLAVIAVNVVPLGFAFALVCLRVWIRTRNVKDLGLDDCFIVLGMMFGLVVMGCGLTHVHYGFGRHSYYLTLEQQMGFAKWLLVFIITTIVSEMFTKISICFFLLRLFTTHKRWRWFIYSIVFFIVAINSSSTVITIAQCRPISKIWDPSVPGSCWSPYVRVANSYYQGAASAFSDLLLAMLPIVFLWDIQITFKVKIGICCLMGLGVFTAAATIVRAVLGGTADEADITWDSVDVEIWSCLEAAIAIIAATIPTLRPVVRLVSHKFASWSSKSHRDRKSYIPHIEDRQRLNNLRPTKVFHPLELHFRSDLDSQTNTSATRTRNDTDTASDSNIVIPGSEGEEGIRKTTVFTVSSLNNCQPQPHGSGI